MSRTSLYISEERDTESNNGLVTFHPLGEYPNFAIYYISSMFSNVQKLKSDLHADHQHEKHELNRLNERLSFFVETVQQLEEQNAEYAAKLAILGGHSSNLSLVGTEWNEHHMHHQSSLMTVNHEKIEYEFEFELFQTQSEIYKQLIYIISQTSDEQLLKLQQELDQSKFTLSHLRTSYTDLQSKLQSLNAEREEVFKQYFHLADRRSHGRKQISTLKVNVQMLQKQHVFYKDIRTNAAAVTSSAVVFDVQKFWAMKWEKIIANIRHDYELLYASIHRETIVYYEKKMEESKIEIEQSYVEQTYSYQQSETKQFQIITKILQSEYEEAQKIYAYEQEIITKLEATCFKLESEYASIQLQYNQKSEAQSKDLLILQESIISMAEDVEEMRRRKISLEGELIIYHRLLEIDEIAKKVVIESSPAVRTTTIRTFVVERQEIASIGIECPLDCAYICLMNHSTSKDIDISRWTLKRRVDSKSELKYTLPDQTRLSAGGELRIYSKLGADAAQLSSNYDAVTYPSHQKLVTNNIISWVIGDKTETLLFNEYGEERASCIQTAAADDTA